MSIAQSRLTAQSQISVPAEVRKRLGLGPGTVIEWEDDDGRIVVKRAGNFTSEEIREALFDQPHARSLVQLKDGIRRHMRKHAVD